MKLIKNGTVMTMGPQGTLCADVLIDKGKIINIAENLSAEQAEIIDASGLLVLPGLVDAHSHIGGFDTRTGAQDLNESVSPLTPQLNAYDGIDPASPQFLKALETGITASGIVPGSANVICGLGCVIKSAGTSLESRCIKQPFAMKAAVGGNPKGVYGKRNQSPMTRMAISETIREYFHSVQDYRKKKAEAAGDPAKMPKFDQGLENGGLVLDKKIPLKIHVYQHDILTCIELAKEFDFRITIDHALGSSDFLDEIEAEKDRLAIIYGPIGAQKSPNELHLVDIGCLKDLDERGVLCAIMTDGPARNPWMILAQAGEAVRFGCPADRVLRMITINAAAILGCEDRIGSLEPGKDADLVLFDKNPVVYTSAKVKMTLVDGEIVYQAD